MAVAEVVVKIL